MKQIIVLAVMLAAGLLMVSCGNKRSDKVNSKPKCLVLYYSQTGVTRQVAEEIQRRLGADMEAVEAVEPYNGTYEETIERSRREREEGIIPEIKPVQSRLEDYDVVFLGYPIWFGTYALPISDLLRKVDLKGKLMVPFCTFGSGGLESSVAMLRETCPESDILDGYGVREARIKAMPQEVERFLLEEGFIEGEVEPLPEFSEPTPVGEAETALFEAACSGYKYPLGTPITFCVRTLKDFTEYKYSVRSTRPDGTETIAVIYVTATPDEGTLPEFTRVVR